jgi:hypothetical protein
MSIIEMKGHTFQIPPVGEGSDEFCVKLHNATGEDVYDLWIKTGPISFLELEVPFFGESGNPPDLEGLEVTDCGTVDNPADQPQKVTGWTTNKETELEKVDEGPEVHVKFQNPWPHCRVWKFCMSFDDEFEAADYIEFDPTDKNGKIIMGDIPTQPKPANPGIKEIIESGTGAAGLLGGMKRKSRRSR